MSKPRYVDKQGLEYFHGNQGTKYYLIPRMPGVSCRMTSLFISVAVDHRTDISHHAERVERICYGFMVVAVAAMKL